MDSVDRQLRNNYDETRTQFEKDFPSRNTRVFPYVHPPCSPLTISIIGNGHSSEHTEDDDLNSQPEYAAGETRGTHSLEAAPDAPEVLSEPATHLQAAEEDGEQVSADYEAQLDEVDQIDEEDEEDGGSLRSSTALDLEEPGLDEEQIEELRTWARRHSRRSGRS